MARRSESGMPVLGTPKKMAPFVLDNIATSRVPLPASMIKACFNTTPPRLCARNTSGLAVGAVQPPDFNSLMRVTAKSGTVWNDLLPVREVS